MPFLQSAVVEKVLSRGQTIRMVEGDVSDVRADGKCNGDELVQFRLESLLADETMVMVVHALQALEALHNARAERAHQHPAHLEQADRSGVEEEVDRLALRDVLVGCEGEWIDPEQRLVVG